MEGLTMMPEVNDSSVPTNELAQMLITFVDEAGLKVVSHINGQANAAKLGIDVEADQVIEVFHPKYAVKVWGAAHCAGIDIPLRFHIFEENGMSKFSFRKPSMVFAPYQNEELSEIGSELDSLFLNIARQIRELG